MKVLVAASTPILNATMFRSARLTSGELAAFRRANGKIRLHPTIADREGQFFPIDLDTDGRRIFTTQSFTVQVPARSHLLVDELDESNEHATFPPTSEIHVTVWDAQSEQEFLEMLAVYGRNRHRLDLREDVEDHVVRIKNNDGRPVTLGQLVTQFCGSLSEVRVALEEYGDIYHCLNEEVFLGWREPCITSDGRLCLEQPEWSYSGEYQQHPW